MKSEKNIRLGLALAICSVLTYTPTHAADDGNANVEQCIVKLKAGNAVYEGVTYINNYDYSQIWFPDKESSEQFSTCITEASKQSPSNIYVVYSENFGDMNRYAEIGTRYVLIDVYQRKTLLDTVQKRSHELVRIPRAGSIEASGGHNPNIYEFRCTHSLMCASRR